MKEDRNRSIFVAGATGAVGRRLCRMLVADDWRVVGTTRSPQKAEVLGSIGVEPIVVDVFDAESLHRVVGDTRPAIIIHQLTDLPPALDRERMAEALPRTARIREIGTRNLIAAARAAGSVRRMIAQSIAFIYAPGPMPYDESAPLIDTTGDDLMAITARAVVSLEEQVLAAPFDGIILRYGRFYGPGTGTEEPPAGAPLHVDAAADAARRAITRGVRGVYNVAESDGAVSSARAVRELGWSPTFRISDAELA